MNDVKQVRDSIGTLVAERNHWAERFLGQMEFVEQLKPLHPSGANRWNSPIKKAWEIVGMALGGGRLDRLDKAVKEAEAALAPLGKTAKSYTIHCVGHAHIDMNWMWPWPETVAITNDTFTTVLKLMEEFPEFRFTQSQASVYALMREYNGEVFEQIRRRVAEGRWEVAAAHWVEGDKNLASGESLARHLLYTRQFMAEHFGLTPEDTPLDWEPDTFGHALTIPSIVSRGGVRRYYMCRGGQFEKPPVFWWQGPDGSRVLVNLDFTWYLNRIQPSLTGALTKFAAKTGLKDWMCVYGVGDHGGGPTRQDLRRAIDMNGWPIYPRWKFATANSFYEILEANGEKLPVLDRELNFEFTGCYTSQSRIKMANRFGENLCLEAEAAAVLAHRVLGRHYPTAELRQAWINTLFGHFHDILPGSGVRATREYQLGLFQKTAATAGTVKTNAFRALAAVVDTSFAAGTARPRTADCESTAMGAGVGRSSSLGGISAAAHVADGPRAFVVFNPVACQRSEMVKATVWDADVKGYPWAPKKAFIVRDAAGNTIPAERVGDGDYWGHNFVELMFPAKVEGLGYSAYCIEDAGVVLPKPPSEVKCVGKLGMENEFLSVDFDPVSGGIIKLLDKTTGKDLASADKPLGLLEYVLERPRGMSSWTLDDPLERICPIVPASLQRRLSGKQVASVELRMHVKDSDLTVTFTLHAGERKLDITVNAIWLERGGPGVDRTKPLVPSQQGDQCWVKPKLPQGGTPTLRIQFPLALQDAAGRYETPFGSIVRDLCRGEEVPSLRWADVVGTQAGGKAGCTLLNDCKYGHSLDGSTLRLTLIRSSYEPDPLPEVGEHGIRLALVPHGGELPPADLIRLGACFNHPMPAVATDVHKGDLPRVSLPAVACDKPNVVVTAIKKAEGEDAVIVRLLEAEGKPVTAEVTLDKTLLGSVAEAVEADLIERSLENSTAKKTDSGFRVKLAAHAIASVLVRFEKML